MDAQMDRRDDGVGVDGGTGRHLKAKVVIVGAGIAGLTAAAKLVCNGVRDVLVLEAQDYVGGRIQAENIGDTSVDMGAMFVHGQEGNPVFEIIEKLGLVNGKRDDWPPYFYTTKKERVHLGDIEDLFDYIEERFEDDHRPQMGQNRGEFFSSYKEQFLRDRQILQHHPKHELYEASSRWLSFYDKINEGVDSLSDISEWVLATYYKVLEGSQETLIKGGYSTVVRALQTLIPEGILHTNTPVNNIDWTNQQDAGILVQCANGDVITADHVIVTISMGCLKVVHDSMFTPSIPGPLLQTMGKMRMGTIGKIFLKWNKPFWTKDQTHFEFLWLESFPVTLNSDKSKLKTRLGKLWWQYVAGPQRVPEHDDVLVVWLSEHQLDAIRDLEDQEVVAILYELMQFFLYDLNVTMPDNMIRTKWKENPYTRGTYTYPTPSFDMTDIQNIQLPTFPSTQNPRLMFAGEAFTLEFMTNVHGAFFAGEQQAEKVLHVNGVADPIRVADAISVNTTH